MSEADCTIEVVLRPPWNFELDYGYYPAPQLTTPAKSHPAQKLGNSGSQGAPGDIPILFTFPATSPFVAGKADILGALDPDARMTNPPTGISPLLAKMVPCAIGGTQMFYFPITPKWGVGTDNPSPGEWCYVWRVVWRLRSVADFKRRHNDRLPFSVGKESYGTPDTRNLLGEIPDRPNLSGTGPRYVKPGIQEAAVYARSVPDTTQEQPPYFGMLLPDSIAIPCVFNLLTINPIYPGATAAAVSLNLDMQQGIFDPGVLVQADPQSVYDVTSPMFMPKRVVCSGNEYAVEVRKYNTNQGVPDYTSPRPWDFQNDPVTFLCIGGEDYFFSMMYGNAQVARNQPTNPDCGVRVIAGIIGE